jgi:curved DNA-binding protein CbpA
MWALFAAMSAREPSGGGATVGAAPLLGTVDGDLYALLGVGPDANASEIRAAYRRAAFSVHPDKGGTSEMFQSIAAAFNVLSCPNTRSTYDRERAVQMQGNCKRASKLKVTAGMSTTSCTNAALARLNQALQRLRAVLEDVDKHLRSALMPSIPLRVQKSLIAFMNQTPRRTPLLLDFQKKLQRKTASRNTRIVTSGGKSHAQLDIEHLRIYTRWAQLEAAIEHQLVLVKFRDQIVKASDADKDIWSKPEEIQQIFEGVLSEQGISMNGFGLSVYVEMRAPEWVDSSHRITSPVVSLTEAVDLRLRILHARSTSWDLLCEEWIDLLQRGKNGRSIEEAKAHVSQARRNFVEKKLSQAASSVERALDHQGCIQNKVKCRIERTEQCRAERRASLETARQSKRSNPSWPHLSAKRLRQHDQACRSATTS